MTKETKKAKAATTKKAGATKPKNKANKTALCKRAAQRPEGVSSPDIERLTGWVAGGARYRVRVWAEQLGMKMVPVKVKAGEYKRYRIVPRSTKRAAERRQES